MTAAARASPRYVRQLDVDFDGLEIVTTNVSAGGIQVSCPEMRYAGLRAASTDDRAGFRLRLPGSQNWLRVEGSIRYADLCDDEYLIGIKFEAMTGDASAQWAAYIRTLEGARQVR